MKSIVLAVLLVLSACASVKQAPLREPTSTPTQTILIIGDSNLAGSFGTELHNSIQSWRDADVFSIAIGGGNPSYFLRPMANICCGHVVRSSTVRAVQIVNVEASSTRTQARILPQYGGDLFRIIREKKPNLIVIALGSNNDGQANFNALITGIRNIKAEVPIFWVGPPNAREINATGRETRIQAALNQYPRAPYHFFSSQSVATRLHPGPADSRRWVQGFLAELRGIRRYTGW